MKKATVAAPCETCYGHYDKCGYSGCHHHEEKRLGEIIAAQREMIEALEWERECFWEGMGRHISGCTESFGQELVALSELENIRENAMASVQEGRATQEKP